jgi:ribonucleoside-diphosphate reductase alpha chain
MMAAAQPFLSGAISKTVNLPQDATPEGIASTYLSAWELGLKAVAVYREGSKGSPVLEAKKASDYEPPPCPSCADGLCEIPQPQKPIR